MIRSLLRRILPKQVKHAYHFCLSLGGHLLYRRPSSRLVVFGVTGTNGKTTTSTLVHELFQGQGKQCALMTTAEHRIGDKITLNKYKQTMLGRFGVHRFLRRAEKAGCTHVVIETSSEGIVQYRHRHIAYDGLIFTNLTPEHLESHGGFEAYKQAKLRLFQHVVGLKRKKIDDEAVPRVFVVNGDDKHASSFIGEARKAEHAVVAAYGENVERTSASVLCELSKISVFKSGLQFTCDGANYSLPILGAFNAYNATAALCLTQHYGLSLEKAAATLQKTTLSVGRMERIDHGQNYLAIVDYAHEPASYTHAMTSVRTLIGKSRKLIVVVGSCGGGRDVARRPELGAIAADLADVVIITNEDPYDDDPAKIMEDVAKGAREQGAVDEKSLFLEEKRVHAIQYAISLARSGDACLFLGKGCEPWIIGPNGKKTAWDERAVVSRAISRRLRADGKH